jgi:hypothetical protein
MVMSPYECRKVGRGFSDYIARDSRSLRSGSVQLFQIVRPLWLQNGTIPSVSLVFISSHVNTPNINSSIFEIRHLRCSIPHHLPPKHRFFSVTLLLFIHLGNILGTSL